MPNWTYNTLTIHGDKKEIDRFIDLIRYVDDDGEEQFNILNTLLPTPQELVDTMKGWYGDEEEQRALEQQKELNLAKYGYTDWYEWNCANWGCKWSDSFTNVTPPSNEGDHAIVSFHTPWDAPRVGFAKIAQLFPTLTFVLSYTEEGNFFVGATAYRGGVFELVEGDENCADHLYELEKYDEADELLNEEREKCAKIARRRLLNIYDEEHVLN